MKLQDWILMIAIKCEVLQAFGLGLIVAVVIRACLRLEDGFMAMRFGPKGIGLVLAGTGLLLIAPWVRKWVEE